MSIHLIDEFIKDAKALGRDSSSIEEFNLWLVAHLKKAESHPLLDLIHHNIDAELKAIHDYEEFLSVNDTSLSANEITADQHGKVKEVINHILEEEKDHHKELEELEGVIKGTATASTASKKKASTNEIELIVEGGGDPSVGIAATHATIKITIDDNLIEDYTEDLTRDFKDFFAEYYDVPKNVIKTGKEYNEELAREKREEESYHREEEKGKREEEGK